MDQDGTWLKSTGLTLVTFITLSCQIKVTLISVSVYLCYCHSNMWGKSAPCGSQMCLLKYTVYSRHEYLIVNILFENKSQNMITWILLLLQHRFQAHHLQCLLYLTKVFNQSVLYFIFVLYPHWSSFFIMCLSWICQLQFCVFTSDQMYFNFRRCLCCDFYELLYIVFKSVQT